MSNPFSRWRDRRSLSSSNLLAGALVGASVLAVSVTGAVSGPVLGAASGARPTAAAPGHPAGGAAAVAGPRAGLRPPHDPAKSLPPRPDFLSSRSCVGAKDTATCNRIVLEATVHARLVLEHLGRTSFSLSAYEHLDHVEQLFVTANLERIGRGLPPAVELTRSLDRIAHVGAVKNEDPPIGGIHTLPGGGVVVGLGANWASGYDNPLGSNYGWMYDDGPNSPNGDCTAANHSGCWGHRDNILGTYATKASCAGEHHVTVMGAGYVAKGAAYGDGETELFAGVCGRTPTDPVLTWAKAKRLLHIK